MNALRFKVISFLISTGLVLFATEAMAGWLYWRNDTDFRFARDGSELTECFLKYADPNLQMQCPKGMWVTEEPRCPYMVWLHNAPFSTQERLLFTVNFGRSEPSVACKALLKQLGKQQ
jgi:hypothetical protein